MISFQTSLHDLWNYEPRKLAIQKEVEQKNEALLCRFVELVDNSFKRLHKEIYSVIKPEHRDKNLAAVVMSGYLQGDLSYEYPMFCAHSTKQRFKMKINGSEWVYVKKLNEKRKPSNVKTNANDKILMQLSDSDSDVEPNIFLGYIADESMLEAKEILAVYIQNGTVVWCSDLRDLVKSVAKRKPNQHLLNEEASIQIKSNVVKLKKRTSGDSE